MMTDNSENGSLTKQPLKTLAWVSTFAIAMGFLESAVVIYLREIYYKDGFSFPLRPMPFSIARVEIFREAATVIMLAGVGILAGKTRLQRFAYFILAFAVWDLFYYAFLYIFLGWPQSLSTWDILFLIPLPWVGPVWAPCLLTLLMIAGSVLAIVRTHTDPDFKVKKTEWFLLIGGALICIVVFMWDFICIRGTRELPAVFSEDLFSHTSHYVPQAFQSMPFLAGFALMAYPVGKHFFNLKNRSTHEKE